MNIDEFLESSKRSLKSEKNTKTREEIMAESDKQDEEMFLNGIYDKDNKELHERYLRIYQGPLPETPMLDYTEIEGAFLSKKLNEKNGNHKTTYFRNMIEVIRIDEFICRPDLAKEIGCTPETLTRHVRLSRKYGLLLSGRKGYKKTAKMENFLNRFLDAHPDYFKTVEVNDNGH